MAEGTSTGNEARPPWPEGDSGTVLLDCVVSLPIDEVFLLIHGGVNDFRVRKKLCVCVGEVLHRKSKPCVGPENVT